MKNPFAFLVGCARSGTTLLLRVVDAHAQITVTSETPEGFIKPEFIHYLVEKGRLGRFTPLPMNREELESLAGPGRPLSYPDLFTMLFDRFGEVRGKPLVANKTVEFVLNIGTLHHPWPQAKFVHLIRDGRDVALSAIRWRKAEKLARQFPSWGDDPITTAAHWWRWQVAAGREAGRALGSKLYYEVRYEFLVEHPAEACAGICQFLGVPYDEAMVRFHEGRAKDGEGLSAKHAWKPPTPGLRDWRTQMVPEDVERFQAAASDLLEELRYPAGAAEVRLEHLEQAARIGSAVEACFRLQSSREQRVC